MQTILGRPASEGLAVGPMRRLRHTQAGVGRSVLDPAQEIENYDAAVREASAQLGRLEKKAAGADKDILSAQCAILTDEGLRLSLIHI